MSKTKDRRTPRRDARDPYREYPSWKDREREVEAKPFQVTLRWVLGAVAIVLIVVVGLWGLGVIASPITGRGNAIKQKNDATNRIQSQARFEDLASSFRSYPSRLATAHQAVTEAQKTKDPMDDQLRQTEMTGLVQQCIDTATNYNADARKYLPRDFRAADLPARLDPKACELP